MTREGVIEQLEPIRVDATLSDAEIVARVVAGDAASFEALMRRHNRRVFRACRAFVRSDDEAEEVMQHAYVQAYANLAQFEGRASFATWLTRIAVYAAMAHTRRGRREPATGIDADALTEEPDVALVARARLAGDPEQLAYDHELRAVLERAIDALPEHYRVVFVLRAVEELSVAETSASLGLTEEAVKTRFFRARAMLREAMAERVDAASKGAFDFHLVRCDRVVAGVFAKLAERS